MTRPPRRQSVAEAGAKPSSGRQQPRWWQPWLRFSRNRALPPAGEKQRAGNLPSRQPYRDCKSALARGGVIIYSFTVHNLSTATSSLSFARPRATPTQPVVRAAARADVDQITALVTEYAAQGLMLPRTGEQISLNIDNYLVAAVGSRVLACAALEEYSPSLAEVASVAVAKSEHGNGLGTQVVLGVERMARARNVNELFALSLTDNFFLGLGYEPTSIARYPEKLARYETLEANGVEIVPKRCFQKHFGDAWQLPYLMESASPQRALRAS
jgi:amino-acid N-acetyltransferase